MIRFVTGAFAAILVLVPPAARADAGLVHASPSLSLARPCNPDASCFFTWTLASRLGQILHFTESRYGPRDRNWTILGVEFTTNDSPQVWYPTFDGINDGVIVQLTRSAATDETRALFQLSHEVVHLLSPAGPNGRATVLEEGLATYNSLEFLRAIGDPVEPSYIDSPRYLRAYRIVRRIADRPDFAQGIRTLRQRHGGLSTVSSGDILRVWPGLPFGDALVLAEAF
jgi:hypothetical protein